MYLLSYANTSVIQLYTSGPLCHLFSTRSTSFQKKWVGYLWKRLFLRLLHRNRSLLRLSFLLLRRSRCCRSRSSKTRMFLRIRSSMALRLIPPFLLCTRSGAIHSRVDRPVPPLSGPVADSHFFGKEEAKEAKEAKDDAPHPEHR